jgi:hypothetical protein
MYSQQLLRINNDEWLRYAETRRLVKQAEARETERSHQRARPQRVRFGALGLRRSLRRA